MKARMKTTQSVTRTVAMSVALLCGSATLQAIEFDARVKLFGTGAALPETDLQRLQNGTPAYDYTGDLRLMFSDQKGKFSWIVHHDTIVNGGDSFGFLLNSGAILDQSPTSDALRLMDLTWEIDSGSSYQLLHRFDRLAIQYSGSNWGITLGRQAVSWGSGLVFHPMDLFNPFAPTTVDTDYKIGDDLLIIDRLFGNGSDMQFLGVARRDLDGDPSGRNSSAALKYHGFAGDGEWEIFGGKHYQDQVYGASARIPVGSALLRSDVVATRMHDGGDWKVSGIVNFDYSLLVGNHNTYLFAEYYHNGFGVKKLPDTPLLLPDALIRRLARGEVFNLMKDYLAVGATLEWHPLWNQSMILIANLHDSSSLVQTQLSFQPDDHSTRDAGVVISIGKPGQEFGGVPIVGETVTSGGAFQGYLRWAYYF